MCPACSSKVGHWLFHHVSVWVGQHLPTTSLSWPGVSGLTRKFQVICQEEGPGQRVPQGMAFCIHRCSRTPYPLGYLVSRLGTLLRNLCVPCALRKVPDNGIYTRLKEALLIRTPSTSGVMSRRSGLMLKVLDASICQDAR